MCGNEDEEQMATKWIELMEQRAAQANMAWPEINEITLREIAANWNGDMPVFRNLHEACGEPSSVVAAPTACRITCIRVDVSDGYAILKALVEGPDDLICRPISWAYFPNAKCRETGSDIGAKLAAVYLTSNE